MLNDSKMLLNLLLLFLDFVHEYFLNSFSFLYFCLLIVIIGDVIIGLLLVLYLNFLPHFLGNFLEVDEPAAKDTDLEVIAERTE